MDYKEIEDDILGVKECPSSFSVLGWSSNQTSLNKASNIHGDCVTVLLISLFNITFYLYLYIAPPAPSGVSVTPLPLRGVLRVTWRAPTVDTGLTITGYSVEYRTSSTRPYSRTRTVSGRSTSTTISGLQLGTRYRVRVTAVTQLGTGVYSSDVVGTTYKRK